MAGLPPKPGDPLPPRMGRVGTSPRAASMRDDPLPRERDRDREDRRPPRQDSWRRPARNDDRYLDQPPRKSRDWDDRDRDRPRPRATRDRAPMDTYVPDRRSPPRRRSPQPRRRSRSPPRRSERSQSPYRPSRSRSPRRRRPSPYSHRPSSRERPRRRPDRSVSPHPRRRSPDHPRVQSRNVRHSSRSRSRGSTDNRDDEAPTRITRRREVSRSKSTKSPPVEDPPQIKQEAEHSLPSNKSMPDNLLPPARKLPIHPPPSGPRRPRTPTGPRARTPVSAGHHGNDEGQTRRESKEKVKEVPHDQSKRAPNRSKSPPRGPRKRIQSPSLSRSRSHPSSRSRSRSASRSRSRSHSDSRSRSRSRSRSHSRSRSRSSSGSMRSPSSRSQSRSPSPSRSHRTRSERLSPRAPTGPRADRNKKPRDQPESKMLNIDELIRPINPRPSRTAELDLVLKGIQEQRAKLEKEHANVMRGVRRAQHELDLAVMEQRSAEERRKAAERVHERTVKGFLEPIT